MGRVREAGRTWAPYVRLRDASRADFGAMDPSGRGYVDFPAFCAWVRDGERLAATAVGRELVDAEAPPPLPDERSPNLWDGWMGDDGVWHGAGAPPAYGYYASDDELDATPARRIDFGSSRSRHLPPPRSL